MVILDDAKFIASGYQNAAGTWAKPCTAAVDCHPKLNDTFVFSISLSLPPNFRTFQLPCHAVLVRFCAANWWYVFEQEAINPGPAILRTPAKVSYGFAAHCQSCVGDRWPLTETAYNTKEGIETVSLWNSSAVQLCGSTASIRSVPPFAWSSLEEPSRDVLLLKPFSTAIYHLLIVPELIEPRARAVRFFSQTGGKLRYLWTQWGRTNGPAMWTAVVLSATAVLICFSGHSLGQTTGKIWEPMFFFVRFVLRSTVHVSGFPCVSSATVRSDQLHCSPGSLQCSGGELYAAAGWVFGKFDSLERTSSRPLVEPKGFMSSMLP